MYVATNQGWRKKAACLGKPVQMFFTELGKTTKEAKAICASCPVSKECLEFALVAEKGARGHGVFGGLAPVERYEFMPCAYDTCLESRMDNSRFCSPEHARQHTAVKIPVTEYYMQGTVHHAKASLR